ERYRRMQVVHVPSLGSLPAEASAEKREFESEGIKSLINVPIAYGGTLVGLLGLDSVSAETTWSDDTIALLRIVGEIFANALEHKREQTLQAGQRQFLELLATGGDFSPMLHTLIRIVEEQWRGMLGLILLLDKDGRHLHIGAAVSLPQDYVDSIEGLEIGPLVGSCGTACYRRERVIVEDILTDPRWDGLRHLAVRYGLRACWSEPVIAKNGKVVGTFAMYYRQPRAPTQDELQTIATAAHLVGIAIEHQQAEEEIRQAYESLERRVQERTRELAALNSIATVVSQSLDLHEIMRDALDQTMQVCRMDAGAAYELDDASQALALVAAKGLSEEFAQGMGTRVPVPAAVPGQAFSADRPLVWQVAHDYPEGEAKQGVLREGLVSLFTVPLVAKGKIVGAFGFGSRTPRALTMEESALFSAVGRQVGIAVENAQFYQREREQAQQMATTAERSRLARELHDSVTQSLYSVMLFAEATARSLADKEIAEAGDFLKELRDTAQDALREMRLLIFELRPPTLEKDGLIGALRTRLNAVEGRGGMKAELRVNDDRGVEQLPFALQEAVYHIVQEALNNVIRHAHAQSVRVGLELSGDGLQLQVADDGIGFDPHNADESSGLGLRGMRERVQRIGGSVEITSAPGKGTVVRVLVPNRNGSQEPRGNEI
ncbi:MAG: GAF domain-containing protein, partial [Acidobacteriota bacterium]